MTSLLPVAYQPFRYQDRVIDVPISIDSTTNFRYVLKSVVEESFATRFSSDTFRFSRNDIVVSYECDVSLAMIRPKRIPCCSLGQIIDISEIQSEGISSTITETENALTVLDRLPSWPLQSPQVLNHQFDPVAQHMTSASSISVSELSLSSSSSLPSLSASSSVSTQSRQQLRSPQEYAKQIDIQAKSPQLYYAQQSTSVTEAFRSHPMEARRLAMILDKAEEIMSTRVELHKSKLPRLFVVLPDPGRRWNAKNVLDNHFRIHSLCEIGRDIESSKNNSHSDHVGRFYSTHVNEEDGYEIRRPDEFFAEFKSYLLVILEALRLGIGVGGHRLELLDENPVLQQAIDRSILYLEASRGVPVLSADVDHGSYCKDLRKYLAVAQTTDLTRVTNYIRSRHRDGFGKLCRKRTPNGNARWVCERHDESTLVSSVAPIPSLVELAESSGWFLDQHCGFLRASPTSKEVAKKLYTSINATNKTQELDLTLGWNQDLSDLIRLREMVSNSQIFSITLNLKGHPGPDMEMKYRDRYTPILEMLQLPTVRSVCLQGIPELWTRSSLGPQTSFSNLRVLKIFWPSSGSRIQLERLLTKACQLEALDITMEQWIENEFVILLNTVLRARSAAKSTTETELTLWVLSYGLSWLQMILPGHDSKSRVPLPVQDDRTLEELVEDHGNNFLLIGWWIACITLPVLSEVVSRKGSKLKTYRRAFQGMTDESRNLCAQVIGHSDLIRFRGTDLCNNAALVLFEAIRWHHLTTLDLSLTDVDPSPAIEKMYLYLRHHHPSDSSAIFTSTASHSLLLNSSPLSTFVSPALRHMSLYIQERISEGTKMALCRLLSSLELEKLFLDIDSDMEFWDRLVKCLNYSRLDALGLNRRRSKYEPKMTSTFSLPPSLSPPAAAEVAAAAPLSMNDENTSTTEISNNATDNDSNMEASDMCETDPRESETHQDLNLSTSINTQRILDNIPHRKGELTILSLADFGIITEQQVLEMEQWGVELDTQQHRFLVAVMFS